MSLTHKALQDRMWGPFPALRNALENTNIPDRYYGLTSVDDNEFEFMRRLMEMSILLIEHKDRIKELSNSNYCSIHCKEVHRDLHKMETLLMDASYYFRGKAESVNNINYELAKYII